MEIWDSHCHIDDPLFDPDRDEVIARAGDAGVRVQVVPGVSASNWSRIRSACQRYPGLVPAYGLHPLFISQHREDHLMRLQEWIEREQPVAVGECGLDYFVTGLDPERQWLFFAEQLQLAGEHGLPVIIHARRAVDAVIKGIRGFRGLTGVMHSYSGSEQQARQLLDLGFRLGLGGPVTYDRAKRLRRIVKALPLEAFLLETDAPDQPLAGYQGMRNEPVRVADVLMAVADARGEEPEHIAEATTRNARELFARRERKTGSGTWR